MTIAIVIGTHGWAAEQLLKTAEMLLGEQENVGWIDFVPGENAETLIENSTPLKACCFSLIHGEAAHSMLPAALSSTKSIMKSLQALTFQCSWKR